MIKTGTPGIYQRGSKFVVTWREWGGKQHKRSFSVYDDACAFKRDVVMPYNGRQAKGIPPSTRFASQTQNSWVYFVQSRCPDGYVKIGLTQHLDERIRAISNGHPPGVDLVALVPGDRTVERRLLRRFSSRQIKGEWFSREVLGDFVELCAPRDFGNGK